MNDSKRNMRVVNDLRELYVPIASLNIDVADRARKLVQELIDLDFHDGRKLQYYWTFRGLFGRLINKVKHKLSYLAS